MQIDVVLEKELCDSTETARSGNDKNKYIIHGIPEVRCQESEEKSQ